MTRARELADLLTGGQTITTADNTTQLTLESTDADASVGPVLDLVRDSASPADGDAVGQIKYIADNDAGEATTYSSAFTTLRDASDGAEDGQVINYVITGGSLVDHLRMGRGSANGQSEVIINEGSADIDFRVESDGNTHMLFVDAASELVTMGTTVGGLFNAEGTTATLTVAGSDTSTTTIGNGGAAINISNTDGTAGNTSGIHFSREDNDGNPHFSGAAIVAQFPDAQADGEYPKGRLHFNTSTTANAAPSTKMTLLEDGNLGIGTTSPGAELDIESTGPNIHLNDSDGVLGGAITSRVVMQASGSTHGIVGFGSSVGNMAVTNAQGHLYLQADTNDAHSSSLMVFTVDNSETMRIDSNGDVIIGKTSSTFGTPGFFFNQDPGQLDITCNQNNPLRLNRVNNDGILTSYQQDSSEEGTVSVSGGTVSYNGGHLSRWSRLLDGSKPSTILKGTVMSNLDQMIVWSHDAVEGQDAVLDGDGNIITGAIEAREAYTENNEQLNHTKVSDAEGDIDVAGVFVAWDDRDSFNDFFLAMTGDMVIRVAKDTTVERGNLLMSAGDGTAKPQGDGYVQDKTIAKVTSTKVSHTYDDGSYLVPCVLMAC